MISVRWRPMDGASLPWTCWIAVRHRSTTATYDVATAETLGLNVIKEQKAWSPKLRRPQRDPSAGSSRHAPPTIQELLQALFKVDRLGAMIGITIIGRWAWDLGDARYRNRFATGLRQLQEKDFILPLGCVARSPPLPWLQGRAASAELSRAFLAIAEIHGTAPRAVPAPGSRLRNLYSSETRQTP